MIIGSQRKNNDSSVSYYYEGICPDSGELLRLPRTRLVESIARELMKVLATDECYSREGKMYGVLLVETSAGELEVFKAFSGQSRVAGWVPPIAGREQISLTENRVLKLLEEIKQEIICLQSIPEHSLYAMSSDNFGQQLQALSHQHKENKRKRDNLRKQENLNEEELEKLNNMSRQEKRERKDLKQERDRILQPLQERTLANNQQILVLKRQRKSLSKQLQELMYQSYCLTNFSGQSISLQMLMGDSLRTAGTGDCCTPKLLQYAALQGCKPLAMAEFWWGKSNKDKVQGEFYGACEERCQPLMGFLLSGSRVSQEIVYEDESILAINKPSGLLSVAGRYRETSDSVLTRLRSQGKDLIAVHRLDRDTSGILLLAKDGISYRHLSRQFQHREVNKVYEALLSGDVDRESGIIDLPLWGNLSDRPYQTVDFQRGKPSITHFRVIGREGEHSRLEFSPQTGRTHQIRVHSQQGLGVAILGDRLYGGRFADRLYLHARELSFRHPLSEQTIAIGIPTPF